MAFPSTILSLAHAAASNFLSVWFGGTVAHSDGDNLMIDDIVAVETKLGLGGTTPARGKALVGTATGSAWDTVARKNKIINGDMRVAQDTIGTTDNSYTLDQWRLLLEAASAAAASQETSDVPTDGSKRAMALTVGSGEDNKFGIWQPLEFLDASDHRGKQVSLQAKIKATAAITDVRMAVVEFTGTADAVSGDPISSWGSAGTNPTLAASYAYLGTPANLSPTTSWATYYVEGLTVGASANNLAVFVWCEDESTTVTTDVLRITDVQLEEGAVCTAFERRPFALEIAFCQRYCQVFGSGITNEIFGVGVGSGTTVVYQVLQYVKKRTTPTISVSAFGHFITTVGGVPTAYTPAQVGLEHGLIAWTVSGGTDKSAGLVYAGNTSARIKIDARL